MDRMSALPTFLSPPLSMFACNLLNKIFIIFVNLKVRDNDNLRYVKCMTGLNKSVILLFCGGEIHLHRATRQHENEGRSPLLLLHIFW